MAENENDFSYAMRVVELVGEVDRLRKDVEVLTADRDAAYDKGFSDGLRMGDARATDVESRLAALEKLTSDQADAIEAQSRLIDTLQKDVQAPKAEDIPTRPYNAWTDG
ncbi:hypothetical protein [Nocardiopsis eucommiae]|uniref:hypothetical protein n=1 Tax=Nocardiopsis eucommiae TaxID=2831970 RepID=UPI003D713837